MPYVIGTLTMLALVLGASVPAGAQTGERVFDALTDLLRSPNQQLQGHVVAVHDDDVVVRSKDNRTYTIATTGIARRQLGALLKPGQPIKVKLRRGRDGLSSVAASMEADTGSRRSFRTATGVVELMSGDRIQFRTDEGFVIPVDLAQVVGRKPSLRPGEAATLTYEMSGQNPIVAVWIEPRDTAVAASPRTSPIDVKSGGYERIHGFVESIGIRSLTLKVDDGRTMMVDIGKSRGSIGDLRPGDLVSVVGRPTGDRFAAELIQKD